MEGDRKFPHATVVQQRVTYVTFMWCQVEGCERANPLADSASEHLLCILNGHHYVGGASVGPRAQSGNESHIHDDTGSNRPVITCSLETQ